MKTVLQKIKKKIPPRYKHLWHLLRGKIAGYGQTSYAQFGEDMILKSFFPHREKGFYVDVGAFHPQFISNTYFFYQLGWQGINIDATLGSMEPFRRLRPRDINLEIAVAEEKKELTFYDCDSPSLNSFSREMIQSRVQKQSLSIRSERRITAVPLRSILDEYLPKGQSIDFLSIDAEGFDLEVLRSNDWDRYAPRVVIVESAMSFDVRDFASDEIIQFLIQRGYKLLSITPANLIFAESSYKVAR